MDTIENLTQIGQWSLKNFFKEQSKIALYLTLTRKNFNALIQFPITSVIQPNFKQFCTSYTKLEEEYHVGIVDKKAWGNAMLACAHNLIHSTIKIS